MFSDLRTPEYKAKQEKRRLEEEETAARLEQERISCFAAAAGKWQPIETCPFEAIAELSDTSGCVWISDGKQLAFADVRRRLGRPVHMIKLPHMAITDHGPALVGGEYAEIDAPDWWFKWEFRDRLGTHSAYGETYNWDDVDFMPRFWMPAAPLLPAVDNGVPQ